MIRAVDAAEKAFHGCPVDYQKLWRPLAFPVVTDGDYDGKECHFSMRVAPLKNESLETPLRVFIKFNDRLRPAERPILAI